MLSVRPLINLRCLASQFLIRNDVAHVSYRNSSSNVKENSSNIFSMEDDFDEEEIKAREAAIEKKRNKSELHPSDYNKQHDLPPYEEPQWEWHESLQYKRRLYGKYGELSKVDPSILWPSKTELDYMKEYEEVAQPFTFQTLVERMQEKKALAEKIQQEEEAEILEKIKNVNYEIIEFHKRIAAKKGKALLLIEQKNAIIEKVRREIGYKIDIKHPKFKEMFDKFQKDEKKKLKLEKKDRKSLLLQNLQEETQEMKNKEAENVSEN